jgi:hypothetical protein
VNSPPPKPEVILTNFFAEPTVLLVPITSRDKAAFVNEFHQQGCSDVLKLVGFCLKNLVYLIYLRCITISLSKHKTTLYGTPAMYS